MEIKKHMWQGKMIEYIYWIYIIDMHIIMSEFDLTKYIAYLAPVGKLQWA